jgi:uncharacterized protein YjbI with pentapeptide repeats
MAEILESETIHAENVAAFDFHDNYFKFCNLEKFSLEPWLVGSDFHTCYFKNIEDYWGFFNTCTLITCRFANCIFRGTAFTNCLFIQCTFTNCQFLKDNFGGECKFEGSIAYDCVVEDTVGFAVTMS